MSISVRCYLFTDNGLQRISKRVMEGLCHGSDAMPQFAGTKQKAAEVIVGLENGRPARIGRVIGTFLDFDKQGKLVEGSLARAAFEALETGEALKRSERTAPTKVVDLSPKLNREKWKRENRWELSKEQLALISDDIWNRKKAATAKVTQAKGVAPKPVPLTYEAEQAVREIETQLYSIDLKLQQLSEVALKGFVLEIRTRAAREENQPLWLGLADAADRRREIKARHRTGKGTWYAEVDVTAWDEARNEGRVVISKEEKCSSKEEAEKAARRLLADHAIYFSATNSVDASIFCDLERTSEEFDEQCVVTPEE